MDDCLENCADSFGRMSAGQRCGILSGCLGFVTLIVYIAVAIEGVEPTEYALIRNNISQNIDRDTILEGGLHWVGIFNSLIHFPSIHKSIEFSDESSQYPKLSTRTKEGLAIDIHFVFQYQLLSNELPDLYQLLFNDYEQIFSRVARNSVLSTAGEYIATDYWKRRNEIGNYMLKNLKRDLQPLHATITGFMLLKIDLPDDYENAIVATEVTNQEQITYNTMQQVNITLQVNDNIVAAGNRDISNTNTKAASEAKMIYNQGQGEYAKQNIDGHLQALKYVQKEMNLGQTTDKSSLIQYFKMQRLSAMSPDTVNKVILGKGLETKILK